MNRQIVMLLRAGTSINGVTRQLRVGKRRVREVKARAEAQGYLDPETELPESPQDLFPEWQDGRSQRESSGDEVLLPHKEWIRERLESWSAITVFEELPIAVPRSTFYRFLERHDLRDNRSKRRSLAIITEPGESLQLDWGSVGYGLKNGKRKRVYALVGVLGYSRYRLVRYVWSNSLAETLPALSSMFNELGGVPAKITTDNPKCFSLSACNYDPLLHPLSVRFCEHYGTTLECLPPRSPKMKGKVERQMPFIRRLMEPLKGTEHTIEQLQVFIDKKLTLANQKPHGTTRQRPLEVLIGEELEQLIPLPTEAYQMEDMLLARGRKDGYIRYRNKYYFIGEQFWKKQVTIVGSTLRVAFYHNGQLIETHDRLLEPHQTHAIKDHQKKPWEKTLQDNHYHLERAEKIGPFCKEIVLHILAHEKGFVSYRHIWGILSLDKNFTTDVIEQACKVAFETNSFRYRTIHDLCKQQLLLNSLSLEQGRSNQTQLQEKPKYIHALDDYIYVVSSAKVVTQ